MRTTNRSLTLLLSVALATTAAAWAQQPASAAGAATPNRIANAQIETRAAGGSLMRSFQALVANQNEAAWAGYTVTLVEGQHNMCCWNCTDGNCCNGCSLEGRTDKTFGDSGPSAVKLEGAKTMLVLFRISLRAVETIRTFTEDCPIDAGGLHVTLFTGASQEESVALLSTFVTTPSERDERNRMNRAVDAIGLHAGPAADQALESFAAASQAEAIREKAAFWMGHTRGARGYQSLKRMAEQDSNDNVRYQVAAGLAQSKEPGAVETLLSMAKNDKSTRVRGQALFWLAQKAGRRAVAAIDDSIANDPDTQVKKKAVFALSQLPKDDGVPKLISVARTNKDAIVRKEAMFWLGQSKDPRAVAFFEEVLSK
jgi:HEAT repeat protein